ncbi:MAG: ABC transporter ATP-binding protein [bacterium]|nr:ABC transporter ATP-binding protein [bacterium]
MTPNDAIKFHQVNKYFYFQHQRTIKEFIQAFFRKEKTLEKVHALKNLTFTIKEGETVGIIGKNGAGKSTLLKLIARVSQPTSGELEMNGTVAPLIELGAGFHPELTGKENVYLNGVILGLKESEVKAKFDEIVEFAEIRQFIDIPIKHYSSGMYMRLAFSVAVFTNPRILLIDEIFAVGDSDFQKKCFLRMKEFKKSGATIVFVSHDMKEIESFCDRVIVLHKGEVKYDGGIEGGIKTYGTI